MSLAPDQVSAVLVSFGDVDLTPIIETFPREYEVVIWDNARRPVDYKVFGRYMGIMEATRPVIYFQDDDCIVSDHQAFLDAYEPGVVTGNLIYEDPLWRKRYEDSTLLGWGSIFDRDLPWQAFMRYARHDVIDFNFMTSPGGAEVVFPMLSKTKTIVAGAEWLREKGGDVFGRSNRMSNQPGFTEERQMWLDKAREVRDLLEAEGA